MKKREFFDLPEGTLVAYYDEPFVLLSKIRSPRTNQRGWVTTRTPSNMFLGTFDVLWSSEQIDFGRISVISLPNKTEDVQSNEQVEHQIDAQVEIEILPVQGQS